jgi:predicted transcriptional regulator with HTH domain
MDIIILIPQVLRSLNRDKYMVKVLMLSVEINLILDLDIYLSQKQFQVNRPNNRRFKIIVNRNRTIRVLKRS